MGKTTRTQIIFYVDNDEEKAKLLREAKRAGVTLTEYINRALRVGRPVVKKTLHKARQEEEHITEKTKVDLSK